MTHQKIFKPNIDSPWVTRWRGLVIMAALSVLAACGGGGGQQLANSNAPNQPSVSVSGLVTGLSTGSTLQLSLNGNQTITTSGGTFNFLEPLNVGKNYVVTVLTQPAAQVCSVSNGFGAATTTMPAIAVTCQALATTALADLGISSVALDSSEQSYFIGKPGAGKISIVYSTANAPQVEVRSLTGLIETLNRNSSGGFDYQLRTTGIEPGVYPYTLEVLNTVNAKSTTISGSIEMVATIGVKTATVQAGIVAVTIDNAAIEFTTPTSFTPADVVISVANSSRGKIYAFEFPRDVSQESVSIKLPEGKSAYDPYGLTTPPPNTFTGQVALLANNVQVGLVRAFAAAVNIGVPTLNLNPYSENSENITGVAPRSKKGLGQVFLTGADQQFASNIQWGRIWNPQDFQPDTSNSATEFFSGTMHLINVNYKPAYQVHTAIIGNVEVFNWNGYEPVLFVHGFSPDVLTGGGEDTWKKFPALVEKTPMPTTGNSLVPFEFHWNANQSFRLAAVDLATTIDAIQKLSGKKVHIVAHSFGGILIRTVLQNLAKTDISATASKVASVMTLGTPHSGILPEKSDERTLLQTKHSVTLPIGQDGGAFSACMSVSCFEMGIRKTWSAKNKLNLGLLNDYADPGMHPVSMRKTVDRLPEVRFMVGMGLSLSDVTVGTGDKLISFGGQRFIAAEKPSQSTPNMDLQIDRKIGNANVSEMILGLPVTVRPGDILTNNPLPSKRSNGYVHAANTDSDNLFTSDGGFLLNFGLMAAPDLDCDSRSTCTHAGYALFREMINDKLNWSNIILAQDTTTPAFPMRVKNTSNLTQEQVEVLQINLQLAQSKDIIRGSRIEWSQLTSDEQQTALGRLSVVPDTSRAELLKKSYVEEFAAMDTWVREHTNSALWSSTGKAMFWDRDSAKAWVSLVSSAATALKGELRIAYAPFAATINTGVFVGLSLQRAYQLNRALNNLKNFGPWIDFVKSCPTAAPAWLNNLEIIGEKDLDLKTMGSLIAEPMECIIDEFGLNKGSERLILGMKAMNSVMKTGTDGSTLTGAQAVVSVVQAMLDLAPTSTVHFEYVRGVVDITLAILDTIKVGNDIAERADATYLVDAENFRSTYDKLRVALLAHRKHQLLYAKSADYYEVVWAEIKTDPVGSASLGATVSLWISDAYQTIKSVVWNFGAGIAEQTASVVNSMSTTVSQAFGTVGTKTITATFMDAANAVLGTATTSINVAAAAIPTANITGASSDTAAQPGSISNGGSTDDTTPTLSGTVSQTLTGGQKVNVYDGASMFAAVAVVTGTNWTFTPSTPLIGGVHSFTVDVSEFDGMTGARSAPYAVNVLSAAVTSLTPSEIVRTLTGSFEVVGRDLPTSGITVTVTGDPKASCQTPNNMTVNGFRVACLFYKIGNQTLEIRQGAKALGTATVLVKTNVAGVTWTSPSTNNSGTIKFREDVTFSVTGVNLLADPVMGFAVQLCGVSNAEVGTGSATQRSFVCNFNNDAGAVAGQMPGVIKDAPGGQVLFDGWNVPVETAVVSGTGKLTDTGITSAQCYAAGSNALVSCTSPGAIALNASQDGMTGRDVSSPDNSDGDLGFSYGQVGSYAKTDCVKDNITGLIWEGKTASGPRSGSNTYTHYDSSYFGTQAQMDAATNTYGYVAAVNAAALCGYTDWRLPTVDELQSIVDYSKPYPGLTINANWFPNTQASAYWSSSPDVSNSSVAWGVRFDSGVVIGYGYRDFSVAVRLVRAGQ